jgi:hypothetical protein
MIDWFDMILWLTHAFYLLVLFIQEMAYRAQFRHMKQQLMYEKYEKGKDMKEQSNAHFHTPFPDTESVIEGTLRSC